MAGDVDSARTGKFQDRRDNVREMAGLDNIAALLATLTPHEQAALSAPGKTIRQAAPAGDAVPTMDQLSAMGHRGGGVRPVDLQETLGSGGQGVVHAGIQRSLGRSVAVKTLKAGLTSNPQAVGSFINEAWVIGHLEHPNVVPIYELLVDDEGRPQIVMRRIEGDLWADVIEDGERPLADHLRILMQVCHELELAHERGVIHRDIKPENIMLGRYGEVYLLDWGLAARLDETGPQQVALASATVGISGTPAYLAPEMLGDAPEKQCRATDVYLLGATLFHALTGAPPHEFESLRDLVGVVRASSPSRPDAMDPELYGVCRRAMAPDPADRYPTALAFREALAEWLDRRSSRDIAVVAERRLQQVKELLNTDDERSDSFRSDLYDHLAACRFGFEHALGVWPENERASAGLTETNRIAAEYEAAEREHLERLEAFEAERDPEIGQATRTRIGVYLAGVLLVLGPNVEWYLLQRAGEDNTHARNALRTLALGAIMSVVAYLARERLKTRLNRSYVGFMYVWMVFSLIFSLMGPLTGLSADGVQAVYLFAGAIVLCLTSIAHHVNLYWGAAASLAGSVAAFAWPEYVFQLVSLAGLGIMLSFATAQTHGGPPHESN